MSVLKNTAVKQRGRSEILVVLVHAWTDSSRSFRDVLESLKNALPDADVLNPDYPGGAFSNADPIRITESLVDVIQEAWQSSVDRGAPYKEIILIGYSVGSLLVRKAYLFGRGQTQDAVIGIGAQPRPWIGLVKRIVLLAGTCRGWSLEDRPAHMPFGKYLLYRFFDLLVRPLPVATLIKSTRRGAPFVSNLRIQWINLCRSDEPPPATIQLLGSVDDVVAAKDNVDVQSGAAFKYLVFPETGHKGVLNFSGPAGNRRKEIFLKAVTTPPDKLESDFIPPLHIDREKSNVVFVMHGIRDRGFWRKAVAKELTDLAGTAKIEVILSGYGYFSMVRFLLYWERQKNVRWFMDQYTEALARFPRAKMGFIGHSNGTYLLASALKRYPACEFERALFAGSVVRTDFPWDEYVEKNYLTEICNVVATRDWIVGVFPGIYEAIGVADLGSAGHNGFRDNEGQRFAVAFVRGGHAAALNPNNYRAMSRFILDGDLPVLDSNLMSNDRCAFAVWASKFNWLIWLLGIGAILSLTVAAYSFGGAISAALFLLALVAVLLTV
jgi:pimeloyl-ACP methyl ester carboxylesterase